MQCECLRARLRHRPVKHVRYCGPKTLIGLTGCLQIMPLLLLLQVSCLVLQARKLAQMLSPLNHSYITARVILVLKTTSMQIFYLDLAVLSSECTLGAQAYGAVLLD